MKKYFVIANILLITAGIYLGVKAFYQSVTAELESAAPISRSDDKPAVSLEKEVRRPLAHYNTISKRNLFNTKEEEDKEKEETPPPEEPEKDMEETKLKLKLWGTVSGESKTTYAVIEDTKQRKQNLYREGDTLQNAVVKKILREQLILTVNGKDEILKMEEKTPGGRKTAKKGPSMPGVRNDENAEDVPTKNLQIARSEVDEALSDVNNLMKQARIRPHFKDGKPDGLTLTRVKPKSIFRKLGLRSGDILMGVDGDPIESVDDALKFYDNLGSSSNLKLQIKRRGKLQNIDYNIE